MTLFTKTFLKDDSGATAIEYGLIAALISVAAIAALQAIGISIGNTWNTIKNAMSGSGVG